MTNKPNSHENALTIAFQDKVYYVTEQVWQKETVPSDLAAEVQELLQRGAILANVANGQGVGAFCYLINLNAIQADTTTTKK